MPVDAMLTLLDSLLGNLCRSTPGTSSELTLFSKLSAALDDILPTPASVVLTKGFVLKTLSPFSFMHRRVSLDLIQVLFEAITASLVEGPSTELSSNCDYTCQLCLHLLLTLSIWFTSAADLLPMHQSATPTIEQVQPVRPSLW